MPLQKNPDSIIAWCRLINPGKSQLAVKVKRLIIRFDSKFLFWQAITNFEIFKSLAFLPGSRNHMFFPTNHQTG